MIASSKRQNDYDDAYELFGQYCSRVCPALLQYYDKNWKPCLSMWADHERGAYFTAGNTTTNRIEAHWNHLKQLIGVKPQIHKTIVGLMSRQLAVLNQFMTLMRQHMVRSRKPSTVPGWLQRSASLLGDYTLKKVVSQYDYMIVSLGNAKLTKIDNEFNWNWEVESGPRMYKCHDLLWTCTCLFNTTTALPCRHLMKIAKDAHGFEQLPLSSIPERWSMTHSSRYFDEVDEATRVMAPLIASVKAPNAAFAFDAATFDSAEATLEAHGVTLTTGDVTLDTGDSNFPSARTQQKAKGVYHVRLRRRERGGLVVLSSAEKYNLAKAAVEPLLEHLAMLSSADFYSQLDKWRETIADGLNRVPSSRNASDDATDGDRDATDQDGEASDASIDPVEFMGALERRPERDDESDVDEVRAEHILVDDDHDYPSRGSFLDSDVAPDPVNPPAEDRVYRDTSLNGASSLRVVLAADADAIEGAAPSDVDASDTARVSERDRDASLPSLHGAVTSDTQGSEKSAQSRGIEVLTLPSPKKKTPTRQKRGGRRTAIVDVRGAVSVRVVDVVAWAFRTAGIAYVHSVLDRYPVRFEWFKQRTPTCKWDLILPHTGSYNYVLPNETVTKMLSAIRALLSKRRTTSASLRNVTRDDGDDLALSADSNGTAASREIVLTLSPTIDSFSR